MTLILLFCILFIVSKTTQNAIINRNDTDVLHLLEAIQKISKDSDVIVLTKSSKANDSAPYSYDNTDYEESENDEGDNDFEDIETFHGYDETHLPKEKNLLRWLPKKRTRHSVRQARLEEERKKENAERNRQRARALNAERVAYVQSFIKNNFWTTLYLYGEVRRILQDRVVIDDMRAIIQNLELEGNEALKAKVLGCYRQWKETNVQNIWNAKSNNLVLQIAKDPLNDGHIA